MKKAAMFGLDARIALAIFGALSVISGAALYSAIQNAKTTRYITDIQEFNKAIEQYLLDTGTDLPRSSTGVYIADVEELITSTKTGWKGPYISKEYIAASDGFKTDIPYFTTGITPIRTDIFDEDFVTNGSGAECSSSSEYCYYWTRYNGLAETNSLPEEIDLAIDGTDSPTTGNVRVFHHTTSKYKNVWVRGPRTLAVTD
tara:strand:+ start:2556 stop:3158 length:603 start_codon:yes stop_codon:yes gene_type:complete